MTLEKAIEIMTTFTFASKTIPRNDVNDALKVGVEAIKRLQFMRSYNINQAIMPLPSEKQNSAVGYRPDNKGT